MHPRHADTSGEVSACAIAIAAAALRQPHGSYGFGFKDPEGRNAAVVCGVADHGDTADAAERPRKISHINLNTGDSEATFAFYRDGGMGEVTC